MANKKKVVVAFSGGLDTSYNVSICSLCQHGRFLSRAAKEKRGECL